MLEGAGNKALPCPRDLLALQFIMSRRQATREEGVTKVTQEVYCFTISLGRKQNREPELLFEGSILLHSMVCILGKPFLF